MTGTDLLVPHQYSCLIKFPAAAVFPVCSEVLFFQPTVALLSDAGKEARKYPTEFIFVSSATSIGSDEESYGKMH